MANDSSHHSRIFRFLHERNSRHARITHKKWALLSAAVLLAAGVSLIPMAVAQSNTPKIASTDPPSGKVSDTVTLTGANIEKGSVVGVFLSDEKSDYKATLVSQNADTIVFKVPQVKSGRYNVSVQFESQILILPVRFTVEE